MTPKRVVNLVDFYEKNYFEMDLEKLDYKKLPIENGLNHSGYIAFQQCKFLTVEEKVISLFNSEGRYYLLFDKDIIDLKDITNITFPGYLPFIQVLTIYTNKGKKYRCKRWSKNIDEFAMDDFLYFLHFSFKRGFENIKF